MVSIEKGIILTAAALLSAVNGNPVRPTHLDGSVPAAIASSEEIQTPEVISDPFFESNFTPSASLKDVIAESERQGKAIFPFAIENPDDVYVSLDGDQVLISVKNPVAYLSNTDGMLYAGIYGQKVTVKKHIDLSIEAGMFTVAEVDEEKGIKIVTQFNFHNSEFKPGWDRNKSREKIEKGQRVLVFSGSEEKGEVPEDTLVLRVSGLLNPLDYFARINGKILYWNGTTPKKA